MNTPNLENKSAEFGIEDARCYFCGQLKTVGFAEHYTFCPECTAIYSIMCIGEYSCEHIVEGEYHTFVQRLPWYKEMKKKLHVTADRKCSVCSVEVDGYW